MRAWINSLLLALTVLAGSLLFAGSANAAQCFKVVDPSGFISKVSWYSADDLTFTSDEATKTITVAERSGAKPKSEEYLLIGQESCYFDILTQRPAIAVVRIVAGEAAREFVDFAISETATLAVSVAFSPCPAEVACWFAENAVGSLVNEAVSYGLDQLPEHREIIYAGRPSSYYYTNIYGSVYNPTVETGTEEIPVFNMAGEGVVEQVWLNYAAPPREGLFQNGIPLGYSENVSAGTCAMFCVANQANAGCQGFNYNPSTRVCLTMKMPVVGQGCVNGSQGGGSAYYHLKTSPDYQLRDCTVTEEEDQARQSQLEQSRE